MYIQQFVVPSSSSMMLTAAVKDDNETLSTVETVPSEELVVSDKEDGDEDLEQPYPHAHRPNNNEEEEKKLGQPPEDSNTYLPNKVKKNQEDQLVIVSDNKKDRKNPAQPPCSHPFPFDKNKKNQNEDTEDSEDERTFDEEEDDDIDLELGSHEDKKQFDDDEEELPSSFCYDEVIPMAVGAVILLHVLLLVALMASGIFSEPRQDDP